MQEIIKEIYNGNINEIEFADAYNQQNYDKEYKLYNKFYGTLTQEQKELFAAFLDLYTLNQCEFTENKYIRGFKTGLLLGIECANLKL